MRDTATVSASAVLPGSPEIDGYVLVPGELPVGELVPVRIDGAMTYDLTAVPDLKDPSLLQSPIIGLSEVS
ncbi:MAG: hypothetical protein R3C44_18105 [Chloroflexota bacterium]